MEGKEEIQNKPVVPEVGELVKLCREAVQFLDTPQSFTEYVGVLFVCRRGSINVIKWETKIVRLTSKAWLQSC